MEITPIYELRERLRAGMIAGTNLLSEDFRLRRAVQGIAPLEPVSPVFAKIGQLSRLLIEPGQDNTEGLLIDAITLVDAVICTQGAVALDEGQKIEPLEGGKKSGVVVNAPYSVVNALKEALTSSGSGHFSFVKEMHETHPELFSDYRIKAAMVQALGASYGELADFAENWFRNEGDDSLMPLLRKGFDPEGKKEMVRRVWVMGAIAPEEANAFFVEQIDRAQKEVRQAIIYFLRRFPENEELLWNLEKTEKGNSKKNVYYALAYLDSEKAERFFTKMYEKKPGEVMSYLTYSRTPWAARLVAAKLKEQLRPFEEQEDYYIDEEQADLLRATVAATLGKTGPEMEEALQKAALLAGRLSYPFENRKKPWELNLRYAVENQGTGSFRQFLAQTIYRTLIQTADAKIGSFAIGLYEEKKQIWSDKKAYFPIAAMGYLLTDEDCADWLSQQFSELQEPEKLYPKLAWAWGTVAWSSDKEAVVCRDADMGPFGNWRLEYVHEISQEMTGKVADILMQFGDSGLDQIMLGFAGPDDKAYRAKLEAYYYKRALTVEDNRMYLKALKQIGCARCEGLMVHLFKNRPDVVWYLESFIDEYLPGDNAAKYKEMQTVGDMVNRGEIHLKKNNGYDNREAIFEYLEEIKVLAGQETK